MKTSIYITIGVIGLSIFLTALWRRASRHYSLPCPVWLRWMVELDNPFTRTNRAAEILKHLNLQPGMTVLDVGCGPGRLTIPAARQIGETGKIVAMDIQAGMLNRTKVKAATAHLSNIDYFHAGVGENKLEHNHYDRVLLVTVLGEIPNREQALKEIFTALKPGGLLSVTEIIFDPHFQKQSTLSELAGNAGFIQKNLWGNSIAYTMHLSKPVLN